MSIVQTNYDSSQRSAAENQRVWVVAELGQFYAEQADEIEKLLKQAVNKAMEDWTEKNHKNTHYSSPQCIVKSGRAKASELRIIEQKY